MKIIKYVFFVAALFVSPFIKAQDSDVDEDSQECTKIFSAFSDAFDNNNMDQAMGYWRQCYAACPKANVNLYINGAKVIETLIKNEQNATRKSELVDTLMLLYDARIANFGQEGKVLGYKAEDMYDYLSSKLDDTYETLQKSVQLEAKKTRGGVASLYFKVAVDKYKKRQILKEEAINVYGVARDIIDYNLAKDSTDKFYKAAKRDVDALYAKEIKLDCQALVALYGPMYESNQTSLDFVKNLKAILDARSCQQTDLYKSVEANILENDPTSESLEKIALKYNSENNLPKAIEYYKKAIAKESDNDKKAVLYFSLAQISSPSPQLSIMYCNTAIQTNPSFAKPYLLIAKLYAKGAGRCGATGTIDKLFAQKTMYWAAVDKCMMAKQLDPTLTEEADKQIAEYSAKFPTAEDITKQSLQIGDSYTINCWVTTTTTVRAKIVKE